MKIFEAQKLIRKKQITPTQILRECLEKIEQYKDLNAFITLDIDGAMKQAREQDEMLKTANTEKLPALFGIPIALKDLIYTKGMKTTAGSLFWKDFVPDEDAFVVEKLKRAGAIILGKTNMHEIALGVTNNNPHFGPCRNPYDPSKISGGSSGGSAVAVATGMALGALGTDTGGSIRIPSALCGVVGLKPTYGRVSLRGVIPLAWHLDHVGPITNCVMDAWILLSVIEGYDTKDPFSVKSRRMKPIKSNDKLFSVKIAKATGDFVQRADERILKIVDDVAKDLEELGATVQPENMDWLKEAAAANGLMTQTEAAAFHRERLREQPELFSEDVRQRLMEGMSTKGIDYAAARYTQSLTKRRFEQFFKDYDLLLLPTVPITAPNISGEGAVEMARRLTRFTASFNISGLPAITLPTGMIDGLPVGVQLVSRSFNEFFLLQISLMLESFIQKAGNSV
ncbi:MAG: amidase [Pseudothermotoga sp.]